MGRRCRRQRTSAHCQEEHESSRWPACGGAEPPAGGGFLQRAESGIGELKSPPDLGNQKDPAWMCMRERRQVGAAEPRRTHNHALGLAPADPREAWPWLAWEITMCSTSGFALLGLTLMLLGWDCSRTSLRTPHLKKVVQFSSSVSVLSQRGNGGPE